MFAPLAIGLVQPEGANLLGISRKWDHKNREDLRKIIPKTLLDSDRL